MAKTRIAREVDEILAAAKPRQGAVPDNADNARGEDAFRNIQGEARAAEIEARMADYSQAVAAQQSAQVAHGFVARSQKHADQSARFVEHAQAWVRQARGTPQLASVERVLASVRNAASRSKANVLSTKRAFEKRFGKYDPRGVRDHATMKRRGPSSKMRRRAAV